MDGFTQLETTALQAFAELCGEPELFLRWMGSAKVTERENSGHGFFTHFDAVFPKPQFNLSDDFKSDPISGPILELDGFSPDTLIDFLLWDGMLGLRDDWSGRLVFVNPPFSELVVWLECLNDQWRKGNVETVVALVPVRTDSSLFHETLSQDADIFLLQGCVKFLDPRGKSQSTPFSLMVLALGATDEQKGR